VCRKPNEDEFGYFVSGERLMGRHLGVVADSYQNFFRRTDCGQKESCQKGDEESCPKEEGCEEGKEEVVSVTP
jgi:hypothetical protein